MTKEEKKKVRKVVWTSLVKLWLKRICMGLCRSVKRMTKYDLDKESDVALVLLHIWVANHMGYSSRVGRGKTEFYSTRPLTAGAVEWLSMIFVQIDVTSIFMIFTMYLSSFISTFLTLRLAEISLFTLLHSDVNPAVPVLWVFCLIHVIVTWAWPYQ